MAGKRIKRIQEIIEVKTSFEKKSASRQTFFIHQNERNRFAHNPAMKRFSYMHA